MKSIVRIGSSGKRSSRACGDAEAELNALDGRVELIQALIPLGLEAVQELLQQEVTALAGARYQRGGGIPGYGRWGSQAGSVYLADQKVAVSVPRVRDVRRDQEVFPVGSDRARSRGDSQSVDGMEIRERGIGRFERARATRPEQIELVSVDGRNDGADARRSGARRERGQRIGVGNIRAELGERVGLDGELEQIFLSLVLLREGRANRSQTHKDGAGKISIRHEWTSRERDGREQKSSLAQRGGRTVGKK